MNDKIVDFSSLAEKLQKQSEDQTQDFVDMGIEAFNENIQDATAFLAVTFDEDGDPSIVWAGDIDSYSAIGTLEVVKKLFMDKIYR